MKRTAAAISFLAATSLASAAFDPAGWTWQSPIDSQTSAGFVALPVSPEIFDRSQPSLNDLRITDSAGHLIPHIIKWGKTSDTEQAEWLPVKLINPVYQPNQYSRVTLDFGKTQEKNRLRVHASGQNFRRRATVEASSDSQKWEMLAENQWLFDISLPGKEFRVDTMDIPANNFRYLRITLMNMPDDPRRVDIESAEACLVTKTGEKSLAPVLVKITAAQVDEKTHESIWEFDTGYRNQPLWSATFQFSDGFFHRGFELSGRNSLKEKQTVRTETGPAERATDVPWQSGAQGVLYRIKEKAQTSEHLNVEGLSLPCRYLQLRIFNADSPPLTLTTCTLTRRTASVIFETGPGRSLTLYGGNPGCGGPSYDLAASIRTLEDAQLPAANAGPATPITAAPRPAPWTERHAALIWAALLVAVAGMLFLVFRNLKQLPKTQ